MSAEQSQQGSRQTSEESPDLSQSTAESVAGSVTPTQSSALIPKPRKGKKLSALSQTTSRESSRASPSGRTSTHRVSKLSSLLPKIKSGTKRIEQAAEEAEEQLEAMELDVPQPPTPSTSTQIPFPTSEQLVTKTDFQQFLAQLKGEAHKFQSEIQHQKVQLQSLNGVIKGLHGFKETLEKEAAEFGTATRAEITALHKELQGLHEQRVKSETSMAGLKAVLAEAKTVQQDLSTEHTIIVKQLNSSQYL